jgi:hypothetical protein
VLSRFLSTEYSRTAQRAFSGMSASSARAFNLFFISGENLHLTASTGKLGKLDPITLVVILECLMFFKPLPTSL